jgi:hypothetical protein
MATHVLANAVLEVHVHRPCKATSLSHLVVRRLVCRHVKTHIHNNVLMDQAMLLIDAKVALFQQLTGLAYST